ncbi:RTA-like protein [Lasiodiplodia theobromae]|uniref:RTA-like protein n=1 Tax=Lasiodiplodia theobromae TaxID=45133 RepID=UPI0015C300C7|nr:RTA-like protein [Lasiodiplodia theobromae]KAF4544409.1 RTA-like protein [Lasiodiplodia theobromae]
MARRGHALYAYRPSKAGAIIFCLLFIAATAFHLWRMIRCRSWFMTAFVIGGMLEFIGYACRTASASQPFNNYTLYPFAIQNSYILLAPTLFAASIYMTLGRVILLTGGEARSPVPRRWLTKAFVAGDILCLVVQGGGGGMSTAAALSSSGGSALLANAGKGLTIFGLVAQLGIFAGFVGVAGTFHKRLNKWPTAGAIAPEEVARGWKRVMGALYVVSGLIVVRNAVRVMEYCEGMKGYIITHEAFLYVFDALLMFAAMVVLGWIYPGELSVLLKAGNVGGSAAGRLSGVNERFSGESEQDEEVASSRLGALKGNVHLVQRG